AAHAAGSTAAGHSRCTAGCTAGSARLNLTGCRTTGRTAAGAAAIAATVTAAAALPLSESNAAREGERQDSNCQFVHSSFLSSCSDLIFLMRSISTD
ncbi:MAG: hypothetical protein IKQ16_02575, partial [Lentisphaeria bacterium]|nr:hypothetical protein [Lentisphaeria bacterium]